MILVTGATGNVGSQVLQQLRAAGQPVRAFVHDGETAARRFGGGVEIAVGDLNRPQTLEAALRGIDRLYLLAPLSPELQQQEANAIGAATRAGVRYVVKHSNIGAADDAGSRFQRWHRAGERLLEQSGMAWTFVRPTGFMSNALDWAATIKSQGAVYWPGGEGKLSVVDPRDIAAVAVKALTEPGHGGKAYDVTGPEALSTAEQVQTIATVIGRPITYVDIPDSAARASMVEMGMPASSVDGLLEFMALVRAGQAETVTDTVLQVTGQPARTFEAWVRENAAAFR